MDELKEMQLILIEMLQFFHEYCEKHSLRYYVVGGTALGTTRHKGFIPWDDDIDVGMPRKDYKRMISIFNKENENGQYILESEYSNNIDYCYTHSKLYNKRTYLVEPLKKDLVRGVYIDVFPLDGAGNKSNPIILPFLLQTVNKARSLLAWPAEKKNVFVSIIRSFATMFLKIFSSERSLRLLYDKISQMYDFDSSDYVGNLNSPYGKKEIMPRSFYGKPQKNKFEKITVYNVEHPYEYLERLYGNWRELPPVEKRIPKHDHILDLNRSFIEIIPRKTLENIR